MTSSSPSMVVIDASIAVWAVAPGPVDVDPLLEAWVEHALVAPEIWLPEAVSALRALAFAGELTTAEASQAVEDLFLLQVQIAPTDVALALDAMAWTERLGQRRAYDAFYVALAQRLGVDFWSADRRLVNRLRQLGVTWTHWVGEGA